MPAFLAALMALISTFSQNGKPLTLPPATQEEVSQRGSEVSDLARNLHLQNSGNESANETGNSTGNSQDNFGFLVSGQTPDLPILNGRDFGNWVSSQVNSQNQSSNNSADPDINKVPADNIHSRFHMPTLLPQVAVDNSDALDPASSPSGTLFPLPPGHRK